MALVYSYIRYSTKEQMLGDSLRRQVTEGEKWIARNRHTPAAMTLQDLGVSALHGKNRHTGALSWFLASIKNHRVQPGSILLVENLDRLSRQGMKEAQKVFEEILDAGVLIVVLMPYERLYTKETLNDPFALMEPLMAFHLAHLESAKKSERLRDVWERKRKDAETGDKFDKRCPSWVTWDEQTEAFVLNPGVESIRYIFEATVEGKGQRRVVAELQEKFTPIGTSKRWNTSFVTKVLNDRAVLGERQPKTTDAKEKRVPVGKPIVGYYPAAISHELWDRTQAVKDAKIRMKGPSSAFVHLFVGLLTNAHDGEKMHIQTARAKRAGGVYVQRRLVSYGHLRSLKGSDPVSVPYDEFEAAVLCQLSEIKPEDLESKGSVSALRAKEQQLAGVEKRLGRLERDIATADDDGEYQTLRNSAKLARDEREKLKKEVQQMRAELSADQPLAHAQEVLRVLGSTSGDDFRVLRERLRMLIAELIESIFVKPEKWYGRVYTLVQLNYKNGMHRQTNFGPGIVGRTVRQVSACEMGIDLRDKKKARKKVFGGIAEMLASPGEVVVPKGIPATVGEAAEVWLKVARARMSKSSFRVVPSKINRFVEFVGADLPCANVTAARWKKWTSWVIGEKQAGRLAGGTARVTWSRSREFARWLIEGKACLAILELDVSSFAAMG